MPFRSAAPAFSRNQIVTQQVGLFPLQTEPHIAVNPLDPEHLVLGVIDYNFPSMATYVSFDWGRGLGRAEPGSLLPGRLHRRR